MPIKRKEVFDYEKVNGKNIRKKPNSKNLKTSIERFVNFFNGKISYFGNEQVPFDDKFMLIEKFHQDIETIKDKLNKTSLFFRIKNRKKINEINKNLVDLRAYLLTYYNGTLDLNSLLKNSVDSIANIVTELNKIIKNI